MIALTLILIVALAVVLAFVIAKNKGLTKQFSEFKYQAEESRNKSTNRIFVLEQELAQPFGLEALERVGHTLGGLTEKVIEVAYVAVLAVGKRNTVASDTDRAAANQAKLIERTEGSIYSLEEQLALARASHKAQNDRAAELAAIGKLLPVK